MFSMTMTPQTDGYSSEIENGKILEWRVEATPTSAFNLYYTNGGNWLAENGSLMRFSIQSVSDDVVGQLTIGNVSVVANDTEIAKDLTLGVWGTPTEWWPGLIVGVGESNIESLNATAFASAERVSGNFLNGTMTSHYENISVGNVQLECIVFDYEQDPSGFGDPQRTHLAYCLATGVLVEASTSYSFGVPYNLEISLEGSGTPLVEPQQGLYLLIIGGAVLGAVFISYVILSRRN